MDINDKSSRASPALENLGKPVNSEMIKDSKNSKFLSIDDILVRNTNSYKTSVKVNLTTDQNPATASHVHFETNSSSEECEPEKMQTFESKLTARFIGFDDVSNNHELSSVLQPTAALQSKLPYTSRIDMLKEDKKHTLDIKDGRHASEIYNESAVNGQMSADWWNHPLWKQIYESKVLQESQPRLTKLLLPSYLMMSQHVLGTRLSFHSPPSELTPERRAVNIVFNVEQGNEAEDKHSMETTAGQDIQSSESASDEGHHSVNTAPTHTSAAMPYPPLSKPRRRRQRQAYTITQLNTLEEEFKNNRYLSSEKRESMSQALGLSENQVKAWFQNRRTKHKKQLTQHFTQLGTSHQTTQRDNRPLNQTFHDSASFVFSSSQNPFASLPVVPPIQLHGLGSFLGHGYPSSTSYLSLLQKMI